MSPSERLSLRRGDYTGFHTYLCALCALCVKHLQLFNLSTFQLLNLDADEARAVQAESAELGLFLVSDGGFFRGGAEILHRLAPFLGLADELVQALAEFLYLQVLERKACVPYTCVFASRSIS